MFKFFIKNQEGRSLAEILIVAFIVIVLATFAVGSISSYRNGQALKDASDDVVSLLNRAHSNTLAGDSQLSWGVHFTSSNMTLFSGSSYTNGASGNTVITLSSVVTLSSISLNGGGSDVIYNRLYGDTSNYGTITVQLSSDSTKTRTVTITKPGVVSAN